MISYGGTLGQTLKSPFSGAQKQTFRRMNQVTTLKSTIFYIFVTLVSCLPVILVCCYNLELGNQVISKSFGLALPASKVIS